MINVVATAGSYLISKLGKDLALAVMFSASKLFLFLLISSFVATLLSFVNVLYNVVQDVISKVETLASGDLGNSSTSLGDCAGILLSAVAENIGLIDAINLVGPSLLLVYYTYFNVILFGFSIKIYRFINDSLTQFSLVVK